MYSPFLFIFIHFFILFIFYFTYFFYFIDFILSIYFFIFFFRIVSQDLVAYIFKRAREYKQCTSSNRINYNFDSFSHETCTSKKSSFLLFSERSKTIYSYFVFLLIKTEKCS